MGAAAAGPVRLGITAGDPAGVGPEIVAKLLAAGAGAPGVVLRVYAEPDLFDAACAALGVASLPRQPAGTAAALVPVRCGEIPADFAPGHPSAFTGRVAAACVDRAARDALAGRIDAVVTAPIAKAALRAAGVPHPGHTEFLAELAGGPPVAMMFVAGDLRVTLATVHVPLAEVPARLSRGAVGESLRLTREGLQRYAGIPDPSIAVLGLNPHAGEEGMFGEEESRILRPAIEEALRRGWRVEGPFPADSFFARRRGEHDAVLAMYHDQGLVAVKLLARGRAVNVTLGLPFLRTSVDHGTAFDIAGRGTARPDSLLEAVRLAAAWAAPREVRPARP